MISLSLKKIITSLLFVISLNIWAQKHTERFESIDVLHYSFDIKVTDTSNRIEGKAIIDIEFINPVTSFYLDLVNLQNDGLGMEVKSVKENGKPVEFTHENDRLTIKNGAFSANDTRQYTITYTGIPEDGLIISKNKYGDRTYFGDNWPDRGKNWLPLVDHPSDKATVEWYITAPSQYQSIGNGALVEQIDLEDGFTQTHWKTDVVLPTKVMVIGIAKFAVNYHYTDFCIPVSSWVYPQNKNEGFKDYALAVPILTYFTNKIAPYPYKKLANVQSKTRFGGMENAGNIFYFENSVTGTGSVERLIAHEIVHQWFGNSASEMNWHHIWLSEGFATYLTNLYTEDTYGKEPFVTQMNKERQMVINYAKNNLKPLVDTSVEDYLELLNPNSYEKGGWVLHMLRREMGDEQFWNVLRTYYEKYKLSNALSKDFQAIAEEISGKDLSEFFDQWLYQAGHPVLSVNQTIKEEKAIINIEQVQDNFTFKFPLDLKINFTDGTSVIKTVHINQKQNTINLDLTKIISSIDIDPNVWMLYELL